MTALRLHSARQPTRKASPTARVRDQVSVHQGARNLHQPTHPTRAGGTYQDLRFVAFPGSSVSFSIPLAHTLLPRQQATFTDSTTIFFVCLNTAGSLPRPTTSSWATTSTGASNRSRPFASSLRTRSSIPRTSSSCAATTSARLSTGFTAFTMSVRLGSFELGRGEVFGLDLEETRMGWIWTRGPSSGRDGAAARVYCCWRKRCRVS